MCMLNIVWHLKQQICAYIVKDYCIFKLHRWICLNGLQLHIINFIHFLSPCVEGLVNILHVCKETYFRYSSAWGRWPAVSAIRRYKEIIKHTLADWPSWHKGAMTFHSVFLQVSLGVHLKCDRIFCRQNKRHVLIKTDTSRAHHTCIERSYAC